MTLYTITGLPYSGKTTLRKELMKRFDFKLISVDEIMDEKEMWRKGHPTMKDWNEAYSIAYDNLKRFLRQGFDVLFDGGSLKRLERETQRQIAKSLGAEYKLIYINTPKKEIIRRKSKNEITKKRGQLSEKEMADALEMLEEPTSEEKPILYNYKMDVEKWIKDNFGNPEL